MNDNFGKRDWVEVPVERILLELENKNTLQQGWSPRCEKFPSNSEENWGVLKTTAIQKGEFQSYHNKQLPPHLSPRPQIEVKKGDILMTCAGPRLRCGVACLVRNTRPKLMMSGKMYRFKANERIVLSEFLEYHLHTSKSWRDIDKMKTGISDSGLNLTHGRFKKLIVKIPPLPIQQAIVQKLETLLTNLDHGVAQLEKAKAQLAIYRQAVLKKAFEGELTKAWRSQQKDLPTATELLAQIKAARQAHYEQQIADWETAVETWEQEGKEGRKPKKPRKLKELPEMGKEELEKLGELPKGWKWERFKNIVHDSCLGKMLDKRKNIGEFQSYLGNINVRWGSFNLENLSKMRFEKHEEERFSLKKGDLVICEGGEPGRCAIWKSDKHVKIQKALHRVRFFNSFIKVNYVYHFLCFSSKNRHLTKYFTGTTIKHLTGKGLEKVEFPICAPQEQAQIVQEIESRLSVCDKLVETIETSLAKAKALRQSILKKAFEGRLLTAEEVAVCRAAADYEPASVLLERIQAEKAAAEAEQKQQRSRKRKKKGAIKKG